MSRRTAIWQEETYAGLTDDEQAVARTRADMQLAADSHYIREAYLGAAAPIRARVVERLSILIREFQDPQ